MPEAFGVNTYIVPLEYAENVPVFDVMALLEDFTSACNYAIDDDNSKDNSLIYNRYGYIWFMVEDNNVTTSVLLNLQQS